MPNLEIRRFESRDERQVVDLHERALSDAGAYADEFAHLDADLREIEAAYLDAGGEFLVGELGGDVVAMGGFQPVDALDHDGPYADTVAGDPAVVRRVRVDPDRQRRGFGTAILGALEKRARALGFESAALDTTPVQTAAIEFFEAHGYEERRRLSIEGHEILFYGKEFEPE